MKINNIFTKITESPLFNKHIEKVINDDAFAAKTLVVCSIAKDVFAYSLRYKTTMENEQIPEKKRSFVAAMDLASGAVTAVTQLGVGFTIASPKIQNGIWNKLFSKAKFTNENIAKKTFVSLLTLFGSGVITERVIVPLIATPIAEKLKSKRVKKVLNMHSTF